jgi:hypothetical protein
VGLFSSVRKAVKKVVKTVAKPVRKVSAALVGGHLATMAIARVAPKAVGVKSAAALRIVNVTQAAMGAVGAAAVVGPALLQNIGNPMGGTTYAPSSATAPGGIEGPASVRTTGGGQARVTNRRNVRRTSGRCFSYRGRRYCYR